MVTIGNDDRRELKSRYTLQCLCSIESMQNLLKLFAAKFGRVLSLLSLLSLPSLLCQGAKSDHQTLQQKVDAAENTARLEASRREVLEAEKTRLTQAANGYESA